VTADAAKLDLLFLGSGNAFAAEGRAFSSFLLNGRTLFDIGPTVLQQLKRAQVSADQVDTVFTSHFHGDHFFGLPFLFLELCRLRRTRDIYVVGPPGVEDRSEELFENAFPGLPKTMKSFRRRYVEVDDGKEGAVGGLQFAAAEVEHVPSLRCFAYRVHLDGRSLLYSGDSKYCDGLLRLLPGADTLVLECSLNGDPVHMSPEDVRRVVRQASPRSRTVVTHLDGTATEFLKDLYVATDLSRFLL
jgi:ribonuclease BN (tRNA processing enzyme)